MYNAAGNACETPKFFGRRKGRVIRKAKAFLLEQMLPQLKVSSQSDFKLPDLFGGEKKEICLEIGFGDGQHLFGQAKNNPQNGYVGVEVFQNGVANLLGLISGIKEGDHLPDSLQASDYPVHNIRVFDVDVRLLFQNIPDGFFDKVFLLFPDPWPKKKHAGRRFVNPDNLKEVARVLKKGGLFRIATDHPVYKRHVLRTMHHCEAFVWTAHCGDDWKREPSDWVRTKYQMKALREGRRPVWFDYQKV
ncbi:MAG: tRNA (guanosine(46)-N7)-methyltransferase TrmB [Alphaproteobacteria bacterium]|nr:tRNA (guanosine(46)-N7)-methyltransferase TrmB [Alphaproteobacteria bacterium]MBO5285040.1 tRNA (guanosine(46)-N7)-methyltransferase TrmB [Alphaproteobacteria bacterium]